MNENTLKSIFKIKFGAVHQTEKPLIFSQLLLRFFIEQQFLNKNIFTEPVFVY